MVGRRVFVEYSKRMSMGKFGQLLDTIDSFLSWWERLVPSTWNKALVGVLTMYFLSYWSYLSEQPPVVTVTLTLVAIASTVFLFTFIPPLLRKAIRPSFEAVVSDLLRSERDIQMRISVINRSPRNRMVLEFAICLQEKSGRQVWFLDPDAQGINTGLGPQEKTEGMIVGGYLGKATQLDLSQDAKVFLRVADRISIRHVFFEVPGTYPPNSSQYNESINLKENQITESHPQSKNNGTKNR